MSHTSANSTRSEESALVARLRSLKLSVRLNYGSLEGAGAELLREQARACQFFLVGEEHGVAELPLFTAALFRMLQPHGYNRLAVEAGPLAGEVVQALALQMRAEEAFAAFNRQHPFAIPFFNCREEAQMAVQIVRDSAVPADAIWALDQEFVLSSPVHFRRLLGIARSAEARAVVAEYESAARGELARLLESRSPDGLFLASAKPEDFARLRAALAPKPGSEADAILGELQESWEIYSRNRRGDAYASNQRRAALMKRHFVERYDRALRKDGAPPKVLFKFGAFHMMRGRSFANVHDIGNLASELATANGSSSFHLLVVVAGGTQNRYLPFEGDESLKRSRIDARSAGSRVDVRPFVEAGVPGDWGLFDLRPLRGDLDAGRFEGIAPSTAELIWGFDAVLVIPEGHAATLFE